MAARRGVILMLFDLPVKTDESRRLYGRFRKWQRLNGYVMFQKSAYVKLLRNMDSAENEIGKLRAAAPEGGQVNAMPMTLEEFRKIKTLRGQSFNVSFFSDDIVFVED